MICWRFASAEALRFCGRRAYCSRRNTCGGSRWNVDFVHSRQVLRTIDYRRQQQRRIMHRHARHIAHIFQVFVVDQGFDHTFLTRALISDLGRDTHRNDAVQFHRVLRQPALTFLSCVFSSVILFVIITYLLICWFIIYSLDLYFSNFLL